MEKIEAPYETWVEEYYGMSESDLEEHEEYEAMEREDEE